MLPIFLLLPTIALSLPPCTPNSCPPSLICQHLPTQIPPQCLPAPSTSPSPPPRPDGLTLSACANDADCNSGRLCVYIATNPLISACEGRAPCYCLTEEPEPCFRSAGCEGGEVCADVPIARSAICVSRRMERYLSSVSEIELGSGGLTMDICEGDGDCKGGRECMEYGRGRFEKCKGGGCVCWRREVCDSVAECEAGESCVDTWFEGRDVCVSVEGRDAFDGFLQNERRIRCEALIPHDVPEVGVTGRIVGGMRAHENLRGFMVALKDESGRVICSGNMIARGWVLTAAHCGIGGNYTAVIGERRVEDGKKEGVGIKRVIVHPRYEAGSFYYDLAVVELAEEIGERFVKVGNESGNVGEAVRHLGYGSRKEGGIVGRLRQVDLKVEECGSVVGDVKIKKKTQICAGIQRGGCGSCEGDSGGGVLVWRGEWVLVGVSSFGVGCGRGDSPVVFQKVLMGWLRRVGVPIG